MGHHRMLALGDGTGGTGASPTHTYGAEGTCTVVLTVTDAGTLPPDPAVFTPFFPTSGRTVHAR